MIKKKVCVVTPSLNMGGAERAGINFAESLRRQGHEIMLLALFKNENFLQVSPSIRFEEPATSTKTIRLNIFSTAARIRKLVDGFKPDAVLVINELYGAITLLALAGLHYPVFISDRASPLYQWPIKQRVFKNTIFKILQPAGVVAQTEIAAEYKRKIFRLPVRVQVIPNALREIRPYPEIQKKNQVLAVGRAGDPLKGFDRLLEAFALSQTGDWMLVFAGVSKGDDFLPPLARKLHIENKVIFTGKVSDIDRIYAESGIFVIPSRSEGFPNALCEAMAAGLPCIAYDFVAGPRDLIQDGVNGLLVENGNIPKLSQAIERLINDEAERARLASRAAEIAERLNADVIGKKLADFILKSKKAEGGGPFSD